MHNITLTDEKFIKIFDELKLNFEKKFSEDELVFLRTFLYKLKKCINNEEIIIFWYIYILYKFNIIKINNSYINENYRERISDIENILKYQSEWKYHDFLIWCFKLQGDEFKLLMRYFATIINFWDTYIYLIESKKYFYPSLWYLIPYLTMRWSKILSLFQDAYFEKLFKEKYNKTKKFYQNRIKKIEFPWEHLNTIINDFSDIMFDINIIWKTKIRRKSYFSLYNKIKRKKHHNIFDILWIMLVFANMNDLNKFIKEFEHRFVYIEKKDYIKNPKKTWYQSIHYKFMTMYRNKEIWVELQVKTMHIEKQIEWTDIKSHYNYSMNIKKWEYIFKEVTHWNKILKDYIKK